MDPHEIKLSPREMEVLQLIAKEHNSREIGEILGISSSTADGHRRRIYVKLGVRSSVGAVMQGIRKGLLEV